jgi:hypothetical protein
MNKIYGIFIIGFLMFGCKEKTSDKTISEHKVEFNQDLADELKQMAELDQTAAFLREGKFKEYSLEDWRAYKDSVFSTNKKRAEEIFDKHGFPGFDLIGEQGSHDYWLIVQHCDFDPDFQNRVLSKMKIEVNNNNAIAENYAYLVDRVKLNTGKAQVYGSQVDYDMKTGQVFPKNLEDSVNVNKRRESMEMEPLENYLNFVSEQHFEMNKANYIKKGVTEPFLYKTE